MFPCQFTANNGFSSRFEQKLADGIDTVTGLGAKAATGVLGRVGGTVIKKRIDESVAESKNTRNEAFKTDDYSYIERRTMERIERDNFCNTFWSGGGGC